MKRIPAVICAITLLSGAVVACKSEPASTWAPVTGRIMTRWAKEVSPTNALPDYPRPQMVRTDWKNLNGLWDYAIRQGTGPTRILRRPDPGSLPVESALSGVKKPVSAKTNSGIACRLRFPRTGPKASFFCTSAPWISRPRSGSTAPSSATIAADTIPSPSISPTPSRPPAGARRPSPIPPTRGTQPRGKQVLPGGIMYTAVTGIWQTVWLEPVPSAYIRGLKITPDIDTDQKLPSSWNAKATPACPSSPTPSRSWLRQSPSTDPLTLTITNPKLWSPDPVPL